MPKTTTPIVGVFNEAGQLTGVIPESGSAAGASRVVTADASGNLYANGSSVSGAGIVPKNLAAALGNSITGRIRPGPSSGYDVYGSDGYLSVANALMGWPFEIAGVFAYSGQTSEYILANGLPQVLAMSPRPATCFVLVGTNDRPAGLTPDQSMANIKAITEALQGAGITPFLATIPPRNDAGTTTARKRQDNQFNRRLREYARLNNLVLFDFYSVLVNPTSAGTGGWALASDSVGAISDTSDDQIHPNNYGAYLMAKEVSRKLDGRLVLQTRVGAPRDMDSMYTSGGGASVEGNIIPNGSFSGTGGTKGAIATGSLADEWSRQGDAAPTGGGTIVLSKVARTDRVGFWQQITISGGSAGNNQGNYKIRSDRDYPSALGALGPTTWQVGDQVWGQVSFETDASGWANGGDTPCGMAIRIQFLNATGSVTELGWGREATGSSLHRMAEGVLRTPTVAIPTGTTAIYFWIFVTGRGTWRFADAEIRKVITP